MKKFGKFLLGTLSIASLAAGAYYVYKTFFKNDDLDEFDDEFEDDFDDFLADEDTEDESVEAREYVSIPIDNGISEEVTDNTDTEENEENQ